MEMDLSLIIKLYRDGKINEYLFSSEIEEKVQSNVRAVVKVFNSKEPTVISLMPIKSESAYKLVYLVNKAILEADTFTTEEVARMIESLYASEQEVLMLFRRKLKELSFDQLTVSELLSIYLAVYEKSFKSLPIDIQTKARELKMYNDEDIESYAERLAYLNEPIERIIEGLSVKATLPEPYIEETKKQLGSPMKTQYVIGSDSVPEMNTLEARMGELTGDNSDCYEKKEIPFDYKAPTAY